MSFTLKSTVREHLIILITKHGRNAAANVISSFGVKRNRICFVENAE